MSIGATLAAARQQAGLSIDDVATVTRIRATLIRQIESDNFEPCGGTIYARGHIRNIATAVGLDPAPVVAEFNAAQAESPVALARPVLDRTEIVQRTPSGPNWTAAMLVTAVLLAAVALVSLLTGPGGGSSTDAQKSTTSAAAPVVDHRSPAESPSPEVPDRGPGVAPAVSPSAEPADPASTPPAEPAQSAQPQQPAGSADPTPASPDPAAASSAPVVAFNGVRLKITVTGAKCWVHVTDLSAAKKVVFQGVLERGAVREFTATSKLVVIFGDAGAVTLNVNGRDLGAPGGRGKVVTVPFVPGDPAAG